jgi:hypothetical protein
MRSRLLALAVLTLCACPSSNGEPDASHSGLSDAQVLGMDGSQIVLPGLDAGPASNSFAAHCGSAATTLSGTALAPNGTDPVESAMIEVWDVAPKALDHGVSCGGCTQSPALAMGLSGPNGVFKASLDLLPVAASYVVTVRKAGFRRLLPSVAITACADNPLTAAQTSLPGKSADGDLPKIAVSSGPKDHLEKVLDALGISEYDCYKGWSSDTCASGKDLGQLLADPTTMKTYAMIFISCSPADTYHPKSGTDPVAVNLRNWVTTGGRLVVTDLSYDFIEQAFPDAVDFQGTQEPAGTAQPPDTAEVGTYSSSLLGTVADTSLAAWLTNFPSAINGSQQVVIKGFLSNWAVQSAPGTGTKVIVHGQANWTGGSGDVPFTSQFDVAGCGRALFSSYHTDVDNTGVTDGGLPMLWPQERILEYLMLEVGTCIVVN